MPTDELIAAECTAPPNTRPDTPTRVALYASKRLATAEWERGRETRTAARVGAAVQETTGDGGCIGATNSEALQGSSEVATPALLPRVEEIRLSRRGGRR